MPWYSVGSVAVSANSATVTGTGTAFSANGRVGDAFRGPDGLWYEVTNIVSATVLSIKPNYQGATATGQTYAIAPMQGYVKESADRLRQFVDQYGATLGSLGAWSTAPTADAALTALGLSVSGKTVASGTPEQGRQALGALSTTGTAADSSKLGGTDAAQFYRRANILGSVSQLGGVPTGALVEYISNANGEAWRYAGGMQVCMVVATSGSPVTTAAGNIFRSGSNAWTFPAAFAATPSVDGFVRTLLGFAWIGLGENAISVSSASWSALSSVSSGNSPTVSLTATGRWH